MSNIPRLKADGRPPARSSAAPEHQATNRPANPARDPSVQDPAASSLSKGRPMQRAVQAIALLALVALVIGVFASPPLASVAAVVLASASLLLVVLKAGHSREAPIVRDVRAQDRAGDHAEDLGTEAARGAGARTALRIAVAITLASAVVGAVALDAVPTAAGVAFLLTAFAVFGAPTWLAAVGDAEDSVRERLRRR